MSTLFYIALAMMGGLLMTRLTRLVRLPNVTAYLLAGVLIGPSLIGRLAIPGLGFKSFEELRGLSLISEGIQQRRRE